MKRVLLSVFAVAALAIGWVGGNGLASSSGPNADTRRAAEIAALSFSHDATILDSWKKVQRVREDRRKQNEKIAEEIDAQKNEILRVESRLEELKKAIKNSIVSIENEEKTLADIEWSKEAGRLLTKLGVFKNQVDAHNWIHRDKWQETEGRLAGFDNLDFKGKIELREEALGMQKKFIDELAMTYETYSGEFEVLREKIKIHLKSLDPPTP